MYWLHGINHPKAEDIYISYALVTNGRLHMVNKGPKTERGKIRKTWTGDGRRRTPGEEVAKSLKDTDKAIAKTMREVNKAMGGASSGKKKQAKKKK